MIFSAATIPNAFRAALRASIFAVKRKPLIVSNEEETDRLIACATCPRLHLETMQCMACTCFVRSKAKLASETCPENRWKSSPSSPRSAILPK